MLNNLLSFLKLKECKDTLSNAILSNRLELFIISRSLHERIIVTLPKQRYLKKEHTLFSKRPQI
jgi:hypothetical protein